jgi:ribonuclease D
VVWGERAFDPNRYWTLDGARELDPLSLGALRELYALRETLAIKEDRPPFKVIANATLVRIARTQPRTLAELSALPGIGEWFVRRHGREALHAIERGRARPQNRLPRPPRGTPPLSDNAARERYARLKEWRKARAEARGVEPDVIVSNDALVEVARTFPRTPEAIEQISALGEFKAKEYGEELLKILNQGE